MIGAVVYRLQAQERGILPAFTGRLMHGVFFDVLRRFSNNLSCAIHGDSGEKPFTVSPLRSESPLSSCGHYGTEWAVPAGASFLWRATGMNESILEGMGSLKKGDILRAGQLTLQVEQVMPSARDHDRAGMLDENDLIAACLSVEEIHSLSFHFLSTLSFRKGNDDFPFPLPRYIFGSLVRKWNMLQAVSFDAETVEKEADHLPVLSWKGRSQRIYLGRDRGVLAFAGDITFDMSPLPLEKRQLFLLLAQFAAFSGVGRLTAQGLGETTISYR